MTPEESVIFAHIAEAILPKIYERGLNLDYLNALNPQLLQWQDNKGNTLLHHAVSIGNLWAVEKILERARNEGIDMIGIQNAEGNTVFHLAAKSIYDPEIKVLRALCREAGEHVHDHLSIQNLSGEKPRELAHRQSNEAANKYLLMPLYSEQWIMADENARQQNPGNLADFIFRHDTNVPLGDLNNTRSR